MFIIFCFYYFFVIFPEKIIVYFFVSDEVFADKVPRCPDCEGVVKPG